MCNCKWSLVMHLYMLYCADQIISKIEEAGFTVSMNKETHLSKEQAEQLYSEHKDKDFFDDLTTFMSRLVPIRYT